MREEIKKWREELKLLKVERIKFEKAKRYLTQCFSNIKARCSDPRINGYYRYGGRGIKCLITYGQLWELWERDNGSALERPSIDRIDSDGDYILSNCRFIEMSENTKQGLANRIKKDKVKYELKAKESKEFNLKVAQ